MTVACLLLAAGRGERLGAGRPKAFVDVRGATPVAHAMRAVMASRSIRHVVAVVPDAGYLRQVEAILQPPAGSDLTLHIVVGGATRQESVERGLSQLSGDVEIVLVHDVARFLTPVRVFDDVVAAIIEGDDAVIPVMPVDDTLKQVDADDLVVATPDRSELRAVQTPQGFRREVLESAHAEARAAGRADVTDDAGLVERLGLPVRVVPGDAFAFKVTRPVDLVLAEAIIDRSEGTA